MLLEELHRDFDGRRCVALRHRRTKVAVAVLLALTVILGVSFSFFFFLNFLFKTQHIREK